MLFKAEMETGRIITKAVCGKQPPGEIVLRSAYCNFNCIPCFAAGYSHKDKIATRKSKDLVDVEDPNSLVKEYQAFVQDPFIKGFIANCNPPEFNWLRIVGGEPILTLDNLSFLTAFLLGISSDSSAFGGRVVIQTNGFTLGSYSYEDVEPLFDPLRAFKGKIVFEVSIKGGNREEFGITTKCREDIYELPFRAVDHLQRINARLGNVDFVAIAGFGPTIRFMQGNEVASRATLYHPEGNKPFFHPDLWDEKFSELFVFITSKYPQFGGKMPMAGMEDRPNWKWGLPAIKRAKIEAAKYFYDSYADTRNEMLEERMRDLRAKFFITEPREYYPSLFTK